MKKIAQFILTGLILLGVLVVYDGFFILREDQQAMITQFGAPVGEAKTEATMEMAVAQEMMAKKDMKGCASNLHSAMEATEQ